MKKNHLIVLLVFVLMMSVAATALAADVFAFGEKKITMFEGESLTAVLQRDGAWAEEGTLSFASSNKKAVTVDDNGVITAVGKGSANITATLKVGNKSRKATLQVDVWRAVTNVTLNTSALNVFPASDPNVSGLLNWATDHPVLLLPAGKNLELKGTCTPSDASVKRIVFSSSDEGVLSVNGSNVKALQAGECDLTVSSVSNPDVKDIYRVLVIQPIKKITLTADKPAIGVGDTTQLSFDCEPANASIKAVTWSSKAPQIATVDENGLVTGHKKGNAGIEARAADGSGKVAQYNVRVEQMPVSVTIKERELNLATKQSGALHATVAPNDTNDKGLLWATSDPDIATVAANGNVTAHKRGTCQITVFCQADPDVSDTITVNVIQRVESIVFEPAKVSLPVRTQEQLSWNVLPADASITDVTFSSANTRVATVDANGVVTGVMKGTTNIFATATDGSKRRGSVQVTVTQPVEGVSIQYPVYHLQLNGRMNVKAIISPNNANNQKVDWFTEDDSIATATGNGKNVGNMRGIRKGTTTVTGVTEDGGFRASAEVRVNDFNKAVVIDEVYLQNNQIRLTFRNRSDFVINRVNFTVSCFGTDGLPLVCNTDGESNSFNGSYRLTLYPGEITQHYVFNFGNWMQPTEQIGQAGVVITSWTDEEGYTRHIPEDSRPFGYANAPAYYPVARDE